MNNSTPLIIHYMLTVRDISRAIEAVAPLELQESYDNAGLQCGDPRQEVKRVMCCLDITEAVVDEARQQGCQLVVSHHPLIFGGIKRIDPTSDYVSRTLLAAIRSGISLYSAHTNLDKAEGGVNHRLAQELGLVGVEAMSDCGVVGNLPEPMEAADFVSMLCDVLSAGCLNSNWGEYMAAHRQGEEKVMVRRVALCGGSGGEFMHEARQRGADVFLTGELRYHSYFGQQDMLLVEAGHYETEQFTIDLLCDIVRRAGAEAIPTTVNTNPRISF